MRSAPASRPLARLLLPTLLLPWIGFAQDSIPLDVFQDLKAAVTAVRWKSGGGAPGVLIQRTDSGGIVLTSSPPFPPQTDMAKVGMEVVFFPGTPLERACPARVLGSNSNQSLTVLGVDGSDLPKVPEFKPGVVRRNDPLYIVGTLPLKTPALVPPSASLERANEVICNEEGLLSRLSLGSNLSQEMRAGLVTDVKGRPLGLIGLVSQRPSVVCPAEIEDYLQGTATQLIIDESERKGGTLKLKLRVSLCNPLKRLKGVSLLIAQQCLTKESPKPDPDGLWAAVSPKAVEFPLQIDGGFATGEAGYSFDPNQPLYFFLQVKVTRSDGLVMYSRYTSSTDRGSAHDGLPFREVPTPPPPAPVDPKKKKKDPPPPVPVDIGFSLETEKRTIKDAQVVSCPLRLDASRRTCCWSSDGRHIYVLEGSGILHLISVPEFRELRQVAIGRGCSDLQLWRDGVVLYTQSPGEIWVFEEKTLNLKRTIAVEGNCLATTPASTLAWVGSGQALQSVDLFGGKVLKRFVAEEIWKESKGRIRKPAYPVQESLGFNRVALSPDGKYLFSVGSRHFHRSRIEKGGIVHEEMSQGIDSNDRDLLISADSQYVTVPATRSYIPGPPPSNGPSGSYLYRLDNLQEPLVILPFTLLGYDRAAQALYGLASGHHTSGPHSEGLTVYHADGTPDRSYPIGEQGALVHPSGNRLLLYGSQLRYVELSP